MFYEKTTVIETREIRAVKWYDNHAVTLASTYKGVQLLHIVKRWD